MSTPPTGQPARRGPRTFPELVAHRLRAEPGRPLVTAYDDDTGERTELSVTTYANWVSKTANLLTDELGLEPGETVLVDLPAHWLVPVFLGAAWSAGLAVTTDPALPHALVVTGPDGVAGHAVPGRTEQVLACALLPFAVRFPEPLPSGTQDYGLLWPGQSDEFVALDPPDPGTVAWLDADGARTQSELLAAAGARGYEPGVRLLTDEHPARERGVPVFLGPMAHEGSLVLLRAPRDDTWPARREDERATEELRGGAQPPSR